MTERRRVLKVLLGSPGDLTAERRAARGVVSSLNQSLTSRQWEIDLLGWEDTPPSYGRPQELINGDVRACDVFIGILWSRWGTPTGEFTSGFEEELELALERRRATAVPEISIFFKTVPEPQSLDPGPDLQRVFALKEKLHASREVLTKDFSDEAEWRELLGRLLLTDVLQRMGSEPNEEQQPVERASEQQTEPPSATPSIGIAGQQATIALQSVVAAIDALSHTYGSGVRETISEEAAGRAYLLAASSLYEGWTSDTLDAHPANFLFKRREKIELLLPETRLVFRSMMSELAFDNRPGWYWFREYSPLAISLMLWSAIGWADQAVMTGAFNCLQLGRLAPDDSESQVELLTRALRSDNSATRDAAANYALTVLPSETVVGLATDTAVPAEAALSLRIKAKSKEDPDAALEQLLATDGWVPKDLLEALIAGFRDVNEASLRASLLSSRAELRAKGAEELARRKQLTNAEAEHLYSDKAAEVRRAVLPVLVRSLSKSGRRERLKQLVDEQKVDSGDWFDSSESPLQALFNAMTAEETKEYVDWFSAPGLAAYRSLAMRPRYGAFDAQLIEDIRDNFENIRAESIGRLEDAFGDSGAVARLVEGWKNLDAFMRSRLLLAALDGVRVRRLVAALPQVIAALADTNVDVKLGALRAIEEIGTHEEVETIFPMVNDEDPRVALAAARTSLALDRTLRSAKSLIAHSSPPLTLEGIRALLRRKPIPRVKVDHLLQHANSDVRKASVAYLAARENRTSLERRLNRYQAQGTYYYNVVCWLDRITNAPKPLRQGWLRELRMLHQ